MKKYYAVLDLGTYKISMALRLVDDRTQSDTLVYAVETSCGFDEKGMVSNHIHVSRTLRTLCDEIEKQTAVRVKEVYVAYRGGEIDTVVDSFEVKCSSVEDGVTSVAKKDFEELNEAYKKHSFPADKVLIDHHILEYFVDDKRVDHRDFVGDYAQTISCKCLLFYASRVGYERLLDVFKKVNLVCKGTYVALRADGAYLFEHERHYAVGLVNIGYSHSELGLYRDGVLEKYFYFQGGWSHDRRDLREKDVLIRREDLEEPALKKLDLSKVELKVYAKPANNPSVPPSVEEDAEEEVSLNHREGGKKEGVVDPLLDRIAARFMRTYFRNIRLTIENEKDANLLLSQNGGLFFTGGLVQIPGFVDYFNKFLEVKSCKEIYKGHLISLVKPSMKPCQSEHANDGMPSLMTMLGVLKLVEQERRPFTVIEEPKVEEIVPPQVTEETPVAEPEEPVEKKTPWYLRFWNWFVRLFEDMFRDDSTTYDSSQSEK